MIEKWLQAAKNDEPVWIADVRGVCADMPDASRLTARTVCFDGAARDFAIALPRWETPEQRWFVSEYLRASLFNILSVHSGRRMELFFDAQDGPVRKLLEELPAAFQLERRERTGWGKAISVAERLCRAFGGGAFAFALRDRTEYTPAPIPDRPAPCLAPRVMGAVERSARGLVCGLDIGGTDIKLALARDGQLAAVRALDWDPSSSPTAEDIVKPILDFISATLAEAAPGAKLDGLGVAFPDVVVNDRILGGETPKTRGMRRTCADYEAEFAKLSALADRLRPFCQPAAPIRVTNDGHMAAFTAAVEAVCAGRGGELDEGVIAHSLGTDLGTGWLEPDGTIPAAPMELYDLLLDLGSYQSRMLPAEDLRSVLNENSGMPGARRYMGQSAAFRLAQKYGPALLDGYVVEEDGLLAIRRDPDMRKPCLARLMEAARQGDGAAKRVFYDIGAHLGQVCREMDWLLRPIARTRTLFGRFVMEPVCFGLIREGCANLAPGVTLTAADEDMAASPLMEALSRRPDATVAQFGQAVGAIYFGMMDAPNSRL